MNQAVESDCQCPLCNHGGGFGGPFAASIPLRVVLEVRLERCVYCAQLAAKSLDRYDAAPIQPADGTNDQQCWQWRCGKCENWNVTKVANG